MQVLYIHGVGPFGGASRSLFETVRALSGDGVSPCFFVANGSSLAYFRQVATEVVAVRGLPRFDNTEYSYYRGFRWFVVLREFFHFPFALYGLYRAREKFKKVEIIHVNEITEIFTGLIAQRILKVPLVVHVRSPQRADQKNLRSKWIIRQLKEKVAVVVAIDETTRGTLPPDVPVRVVHNSFTPKVSGNSDPVFAKRLDSLSKTALKVGFVGNILLAKGIFDLLEAAKIIKDSGRDVEFVIVGGWARRVGGLRSFFLKKIGLAQDVYDDLVARIHRYGLESSFHLLGPTSDIQSVYEKIDVIAFPSHFDAPGRPIFEAAFSAVPCIACVSNPKPDTLQDRETGLAVKAKDPKALADAISYFSDNRDEVGRMGANAKKMALENYEPSSNAIRILGVYRDVLDGKGL